MANPPDVLRGPARAIAATCAPGAAAKPRLRPWVRGMLAVALWALAGVACDTDSVPAGELEDTGLASDAAPPDAEPIIEDFRVPMGPCAAAVPLRRGDEGVWMLSGETTADDHQSRCGGRGGDDALLVFTAPQAGRWRFHVRSADFDPMLSARGDCVLAASERVCNDDIGWPRARSAAVQLDLTTDETVYLVVDAYAGPDGPEAVGGAFEVEARLVPVQPPEAPCDPLGLADGCRAGHVCAADHPGLLGGPGTCRPDTAPRWVRDPVVRVDGSALTLHGAGADLGGDVVALQLQLLDAEGQALPLGRGDVDVAEVLLDVAGQTEFELSLRGALPEGVEGLVQVKVWLVDARGHACAPFIGAPLALPLSAVADTCDPERLADRCPEGTACLNASGIDRCRPIGPPTLSLARLHRAPEGQALGLWAQGTDPDQDLLGAWIGVTDERGRLVAEAVRRFDAVAWDAEGAFEAHFSFATQPELQYADALVVLFDAEGLQTAPLRVAVGAPESVEAEATCDLLGALTVCPDALACVPPMERAEGPPPAEGPHCATPPTQCDVRQGTAEIHGDGAGGFEAWFDLWDAPAGEASSCGGGVAQVVVPFTAPTEGWWSFALDGDGELADPVLSVRSHCALAAGFSELACNDDRAAGDRQSRVSLRLAAGAIVYAVADGYQGAEGWWAGAARLHIRPAR